MRLKPKTAIWVAAISIFFVSQLPLSANAEKLKVQSKEASPGEIVKLKIFAEGLPQGFSRLDGRLRIEKPDLAELSEINPKAVSEKFLKVNSKTEATASFRLVDIMNEIKSGEEKTIFLTAEVKCLKTGETDVLIDNVVLTDEEGEEIDVDLTSGKLVITSDKGEEEKPKEGEEEKKKESYQISLDNKSIQQGKNRVTVSLSPMPEGLQMATLQIGLGESISYRGAEFVDGYGQVLNYSPEKALIRWADFRGEIPPETERGDLIRVIFSLVDKKESPGKLEVTADIVTDKGRNISRKKTFDLPIGAAIVGKSKNPPDDLDGDGLYEDVNGDGSLNEKDAFVLAFNLSSPVVKGNDKFDFNGDGKINFSDAQDLFTLATKS